MWVCLNNAFLSIVSKDCGPGELMVRARRRMDITRVFPDATVTRTPGKDYLFRAVLKRAVVAKAIADAAENIDYDNFKNSVSDNRLHDAYSQVWTTMSRLQNVAPWSGGKRAKPAPQVNRRQGRFFP